MNPSDSHKMTSGFDVGFQNGFSRLPYHSNKWNFSGQRRNLFGLSKRGMPSTDWWESMITMRSSSSLWAAVHVKKTCQAQGCGKRQEQTNYFEIWWLAGALSCLAGALSCCGLKSFTKSSLEKTKRLLTNHLQLTVAKSFTGAQWLGLT